MTSLGMFVYVLYFKYVDSEIQDRGTKGDNGAAKDLGAAKKTKDANGKEVMEVEVPTAREDVDRLWSASQAALATKPPEAKEHRDAATKQADHDRNSRTNVVLAWVGTNMYVLDWQDVLDFGLNFAYQGYDPRLHVQRLRELGQYPRREDG